MKTVEFFYDLVSPYSYLAYGPARRVCEAHGAELVLRPVLLGAVHKAAGITSPVEIESKSRYQMQDIRRWAEHYDLPMDFPNPFPFQTLKSMRAAMFCGERGTLEAFTREGFSLYWEEGGAPEGVSGDEEGPVAEISRRIGEDPGEVLAGVSTPEAKQALKAATTEALERGVFGAPTFFVNGEMFWGNDRLDFVEAELARA